MRVGRAMVNVIVVVAIVLGILAGSALFAVLAAG
jgi:hypothetical protein